MSLVLRSTKGSALTHAELDGNFTTIQNVVNDYGRVYISTAAMLADATLTYSDVEANDIIHNWIGGFNYKVAASGASDHHLTTAGGVKLYLLPGPNGEYNFMGMNPAADGVTDDYPKLALLLAITQPNPTIWYTMGPEIYFPANKYYLDAGVNGIQLKTITHLRGHAPSGMGNTTTGSELIFPVDCPGIVVNNYTTLNGDVEFVATTAADGSCIENLCISSTIGTNKNAHGITLRARAVVRNCTIERFSGDGIHVEAPTAKNEQYYGDGVETDFAISANLIDETSISVIVVDMTNGTRTTKVRNTHYTVALGTPVSGGYSDAVVTFLTPPAATDRVIVNGRSGGNANNFYLNTIRVQFCENGVYVNGADANAGVGIMMECSFNRRWGIWDSSFLGNTWIACHEATGGFLYPYPNPTESAFASYGGLAYQAVPPADSVDDLYIQELLVATQPGTDNTIWRQTNLASLQFCVPWTGAEAVGTFRTGGSYLSDNLNARTMWLGCYAENGSGEPYYGPTSMAVGGIGAVPARGGGLSLDANNDALSVRTGLYSQNTALTNDRVMTVSINTNSANGDVFSFQGVDASGANDTGLWRLKKNGTGWIVDQSNSGARIAYWLTGSSETWPYKFKVVDMVLGNGATNERRFGRQSSTSSGVVFPTSGDYTAGDTYIAVTPTVGDYIGWVCTTTGTAGSTAVFKKFGRLEPTGGTVAQGSGSGKATGVTLNTNSGEITMVAANLVAGTTIAFTLTNSTIGANDNVIVHRKSVGTNDAYNVWVDSVAAGSCRICVRNITGGDLAEAIKLQFTVIKGAIA